MRGPAPTDSTSESGPRVLVVDDDPTVLGAVTRVLQHGGCAVTGLVEPTSALHFIRHDASVDVALLDIMLPGMSGIELLREAKAHRPNLAVVMMTSNSSVESAVESVRSGAFDYLSKPFESLDMILLTVRRAWEHHRLLAQNRDLKRLLEAKEGLDEIVGQSPRMQRVFELVQAVSATPATVLVRGESGTGKELVARAIHRRSDRAKKPFHAVNCSALAESVLDAELFGHTKGAFTGALTQRKGLFEAAHGGTLFLDEIGDVSPATQVRLLRVLQEGEVKPIGANDAVTVDVRIIAATHTNLEDAITRKAFREDLFYRLNVVAIDVPPLRARREDIMLLAQHFLLKHAQRMKRDVRGFSDDAARVLQSHPWPGNVRELENAVARGVVMCPGTQIETAMLPPALAGTPPTTTANTSGLMALPYVEAKRAALAAFEQSYLEAKVREAGGNISRAARSAGVDRSNFKRLLRTYGRADARASDENAQ